MTFEQIDLDLLAQHRVNLQREHASGRRPTKRWQEAQLLWAGAHYLLVRDGPYEGSRRTVLLNREALLLSRGNPDRVPLYELALAAIHPVHKYSPQRRIILHASKTSSQNGHKLFRGLRWSRDLRKGLIRFAELKDEEFPAAEQEWIADFEEKHAFSKRCIDYFEGTLGAKIYGPTKRDGFDRPADMVYRTSSRPPSLPFNREVSLRPMSHSKQVRVFNKEMDLDEDEFYVLVDALAEIRRMKEEKKQAVE